MSIIEQNLLSPAILCYFLGIFTKVIKSDLEFTQSISKLLSLYLLFTIGFKGGTGLVTEGFQGHVLSSLGAAALISFLIPFGIFYYLRNKTGVPNAAAIAATYGSVSAVTFIAAIAYLDQLNIPYGKHMIAALALMESPAIIAGVLLANIHTENTSNERPWAYLLKESFCNGSIVLLIGAMLIGYATGESGATQLKPFTHDIFYGMLCLFLLDRGIATAASFGSLRDFQFKILSMGVVFPIVNSIIGMGIATALNLSMGNALLFTVLTASASYIAVPAAIKYTIPEAESSLYLMMALAVTFPFNVIFGIPLYHQALVWVNSY